MADNYSWWEEYLISLLSGGSQTLDDYIAYKNNGGELSIIRWVFAGFPEIPTPAPQITYDNITQNKELTSEEKFGIIAEEFPDRLAEWLRVGGADWVSSLPSVAGIVELPNGMFWNNTEEYGGPGLLDPEYAQQIINEATGVEPIIIPEGSTRPAPGIYKTPDGKYIDSNGVEIPEETALLEIAAYEKGINPPDIIPDGSEWVAPELWQDAEGKYWDSSGYEVDIKAATKRIADFYGIDSPLPEGAVWVAPGLYQLPDGSYGVIEGKDWIPVDEASAQRLIDQFMGVEKPPDVPPEASFVAPGLYQLPEGGYVDDKGHPVPDDLAQLIIESFERELTPEEKIPPDAILKAPGVYQLPDGSYIDDQGVEIDPDLAQGIIDSFLEDIAVTPPIDIPEGWTLDPTTGVYTDTEGNEYYPDPNQPGELIPVTPTPGAPPGSTFNPITGVWTDPAGNQLTQDPEGNLVPVTPGVLPPNLPPDAQEIIPDQIYQLPDGSYVNPNGYPIPDEQALQRIEDYESGLSGEIEPYPEEPPPPGNIWDYNPNTGQWEPILDPLAITPWQQSQLDLQQSQLAQQEAQFQAQRATEQERYLANLRAQPASWLEYAELQKEPAVVQPWMEPLMRAQYEGLDVGEPIPGTGMDYQYWGEPMGGLVPTNMPTSPYEIPEDWRPQLPEGYGVSYTGDEPYSKEEEKRLNAMYKHILDRLVADATGGGYLSEGWWALPMEEKAALQEEAQQLARTEYKNETGDDYPVYPTSSSPSQGYITGPEGMPGVGANYGMWLQSVRPQKGRRTDYSLLPELTPPSVQYQARMGPTATQQFYGYEQARTAEPPEHTQWKLWSQAPASMGFGRELLIRR